MNTFDVTLLAAACGLVALGVYKGLVRILVGIAALVAAFALAAVYHRPLAATLGWLGRDDGPRLLASYVLIFVGVLLLGGLTAFLLRNVVKIAMLGWADRLAGGVLGLASALLFAALVILPLVAYAPRGGHLLDRSRLAPYVALVADLARPLAPQELSRRYDERIDALRDLWRSRR